MSRPLFPLLPALLLLAGCHGLLGGRTTQEDQDLNSFAEARRRGGQYYDGGDYVRAALQFQKALEIRTHDEYARLGYAYSLMKTNLPSNLLEARKQFEDVLGHLSDKKPELSRLFGLGLTYQALAARYDHRSYLMDQNGKVDEATHDRAVARDYARKGIENLEQVLKLDPYKASLKPDAHIGIAQCEIVLIEPQHPEHIDRAVDQIRQYAHLAHEAREAWKKRRERLLSPEPLARENATPPNTPYLQTKEEEKQIEKNLHQTIEKEVLARRALVATLGRYGRYRDAIHELDQILKADPTQTDVYFLRGTAYAKLTPPDYAAALVDLKHFRNLQDPTKLTDRDVQLNILIQDYEKRLAKQGGATQDKQPLPAERDSVRRR